MKRKCIFSITTYEDMGGYMRGYMQKKIINEEYFLVGFVNGYSPNSAVAVIEHPITRLLKVVDISNITMND